MMIMAVVLELDARDMSRFMPRKVHETERAHRLKIFAFHVRCILDMENGDKITFSFWDYDNEDDDTVTVVEYKDGLAYVDDQCAGTKIGAVHAYADRCAGGFARAVPDGEEH